MSTLIPLSFVLVVLTASPSVAEQSVRVGGDQSATTVMHNGQFRSGTAMVEESLPEGYPAPTPPGAIDLKYYPSIRRAEFSANGTPDRGTQGAFFPLFNHIQDRGIAMTSPVEMDFERSSRDAGPWTMSFLYRTSDLGPTGTDGDVVVRDTDPMTVVSLGLQGPYGMQLVERGVAQLESWLDGQSEWEAAGSVRALYYNGPYIPDARKWAEVQIPVTRSQPSEYDKRRASIVAKLNASAAFPDSSVETIHRMDAAGLLTLAVERGAPLYNNDQPAACAVVYEVTLQSVLAMDLAQLDLETQTAIVAALSEAGAEHDPRERAWVLRRMIDRVFTELHHAS